MRPFNQSSKKCYILHFLLGLYRTLNRVSLSVQSVKRCWVACKVCQNVCWSLFWKQCKLGLSLWDKCVVRQTLFSQCPHTFAFVMALLLALSKTVGSCIFSRRFRHPWLLLRYLTFFTKKKNFLVQRWCAHSCTWKVQLSLTDRCSVLWDWAKINEGLLIGVKSSHLSFAAPPNFHCVWLFASVNR